MASWPTSVATDATLSVAVNSLQTTLGSGINASVTSIPLASTTGFPTAGYVTIDNEVISYTGVSGGNLTGATRGADGTSAATHNTGAAVSATIVAAHHNSLKNEVEAIETDMNNCITTITPATPGATATSMANRWAQLAQQLINITGLANWYSTFTSLPVAKGGTNSTAALNSGRVMISSGGAIVEAAALTANSVMTTNGGGTPNTGGATIQGTLTVNGQLNFTATGSQGLTGTATNDSAVAGNVGQYVSAGASSVAAPTTTQYGDATSISLTAGDWDVSVGGWWQLNTATWSSVACGVSTATGNSQSGLVIGDNQMQNAFASTTTNPTQVSFAIPSVRFSLASTTTVYLKFSAAFSAGSPLFSGRISARRVR